MELSSYVAKEWKQRFKVHEVRFIPETGLFSPPDRLVVVGQLYGQDESSIVEVPYEVVKIKYREGIKPKLTVHIPIREGQRRNAFVSGYFTKEEMTLAEFQLPKGYKILGEPKSVEGE